MRWLSDNVGGFFRECGDEEDWNEFYTMHDFKKAMQLVEKRKKSYEEHLEEYLKTDNGEAYRFIMPRLLYFGKTQIGYPAALYSKEEWDKILKEMVQGMWQNDYKLFVENFFYLWD